MLSSMGNSLVIVSATGDLKVAKDREERRYTRAKDRGRFDRSNTVPPRGSFLFPLPKPRDLSLPSRSCVSYVRANSISRDSFRSAATYKLFPNRSTFLASCFSWRGRVTPKKRRQLIVRRHAEFRLDVYAFDRFKTAPPFLSRFSQPSRPPESSSSNRRAARRFNQNSFAPERIQILRISSFVSWIVTREDGTIVGRGGATIKGEMEGEIWRRKLGKSRETVTERGEGKRDFFWHASSIVLLLRTRADKKGGAKKGAKNRDAESRKGEETIGSPWSGSGSPDEIRRQVVVRDHCGKNKKKKRRGKEKRRL